MSCHILAYTFEADYHCPHCAEHVHGVPMTSPGHLGEPNAEGNAWTDSEGNEAHPLFQWDEWAEFDPSLGETVQTLHCSDCGGELDRVEIA